jgi:glucose-6-phosphate 1-epimerase
VASDGAVTVVLGLQDCLATRAIWPYSFRLELTVRLADTLSLTLSCRNRDRERYSFTTALHTYFQVTDAAQASVEGLQGLVYREFAAGNARGTEAREAVPFDGEVDRAYIRVPHEVVLRDGAAGHSIRIRQENLPEVVLWNPGAEKVKELPDMANGEFREMVCVETCAIAEPVQLRPGETWIGTTEFVAE